MGHYYSEMCCKKCGEIDCDCHLREERECPGCGALVDVTGIGEYNMVNCHNCGIDLEIHKGTLVEV